MGKGEVGEWRSAAGRMKEGEEGKVYVGIIMTATN